MVKLTMKYQLKDSGVEWLGLGQVPEHWQVKKLKRLSQIDSGTWGNDFDGEDGTEVLRSNEISIDGKWKIETPAIRKLSKLDKVRKKLQLNDLLLVKSSGSEKHIGKTAIVNNNIASRKSCFSNFTSRIRTSENVLISKLLWYFFNSVIGRVQLIFIGTTTTGLINLNASKIGQVFFTLPPLKEQTAIADYLDKACKNIDAIISLKQKQVTVINNYRKSLIHEAVTKGLDKKAKLKDSGVEWLGDVPEHWKLKKLTELTTFTVGFTPPSNNFEYYGGIHKWVTIDDLNGNIIGKTKRTLSDLGIVKRENKIAKKGSLLYSFKLTVGKTAFVEEDIYTNEAIAAFKPNKKLNMRFFSYSIRTYLIEYANENIYGAPLLNDTLIKCSRILHPPLKEQTTIADYLDKACDKIDQTASNLKQQIRQLQAYRKSLIFECVTGKKQIYQGKA